MAGKASWADQHLSPSVPNKATAEELFPVGCGPVRAPAQTPVLSHL